MVKQGGWYVTEKIVMAKYEKHAINGLI